MSVKDFQEYRRHLDAGLRGQFANHRDRLKEIGKRWQALGSRQDKLAEVARIRLAAVAGEVDTAVADDGADTAVADDGADTAVADDEADTAVADDETDTAETSSNEEDASTTDSNGQQQPGLPDDVNLDLMPDSSPFLIACPTIDRQRMMFQQSERHMDLKRKREFLESDAGLGGEWVGAGSPSSGHLNTVGVWVHINNNGTVDDRVVVKDTYMSFDQWMSVSMWSGDVKSTNRTPLEFATLKRLADNVEDTNPFVELRFNRVSVSYTKMMYRMYFDFLPYHDASLMLSYYGQLRSCIPEPWLWNILEALAKAALIMEQGSIGLPVEDWKQIIHRDIKPANIFFGPEDNQIYPSYKAPKLGDFGLAFETGPDDPFNPAGYKSDDGAAGTPGYQAPENFVWMNNTTKEVVDDFHILSPCNIWSIGATMVDLMTKSPLPVPGVQYVRPGFDMHATNEYSPRLRSLVTQCLDYVPSRRIRAATLLNEVLLATGAIADDEDDEPEEDFSQGRRSGENWPARRHNNYVIHPFMAYKIGMSRPDVDAMRNEDIDQLTDQEDTQ